MSKRRNKQKQNQNQNPKQNVLNGELKVRTELVVARKNASDSFEYSIIVFLAGTLMYLHSLVFLEESREIKNQRLMFFLMQFASFLFASYKMWTFPNPFQSNLESEAVNNANRAAKHNLYARLAQIVLYAYGVANPTYGVRTIEGYSFANALLFMIPCGMLFLLNQRDGTAKSVKKKRINFYQDFSKFLTASLGQSSAIKNGFEVRFLLTTLHNAMGGGLENLYHIVIKESGSYKDVLKGLLLPALANHFTTVVLRDSDISGAVFLDKGEMVLMFDDGKFPSNQDEFNAWFQPHLFKEKLEELQASINCFKKLAKALGMSELNFSYAEGRLSMEKGQLNELQKSFLEVLCELRLIEQHGNLITFAQGTHEENIDEMLVYLDLFKAVLRQINYDLQDATVVQGQIIVDQGELCLSVSKDARLDRLNLEKSQDQGEVDDHSVFVQDQKENQLIRVSGDPALAKSKILSALLPSGTEEKKPQSEPEVALQPHTVHAAPVYCKVKRSRRIMPDQLSRLFVVEDKNRADHVDFGNGVCWDEDSSKRTAEVFRIDDHTYVYIPNDFLDGKKGDVEVLKKVIDQENGYVRSARSMGTNGYVPLPLFYKIRIEGKRIIGKLKSSGCGSRLVGTQDIKSPDGRSRLIVLDTLYSHDLRRVISKYDASLPNSLIQSPVPQ